MVELDIEDPENEQANSESNETPLPSSDEGDTEESTQITEKPKSYRDILKESEAELKEEARNARAIKRGEKKVFSQEPPQKDFKEEQSESEEDLEPVSVPQHWSAKNKNLFAKAPRELQSAIYEEMQKTYRWGSQVANEVRDVKAFKDEIDQVFAPFRSELRRAKINLPTAIKSMLEWQSDLNNEGTRKEALIDLISNLGLTPQDLVEEQQHFSTAYDPRFAEATRRIEELERFIQDQQQGMVQDNNAQLQRLYEDFKSEVDESGRNKHPYVDKYESLIAAYIEQLNEREPHLAPRTKLEKAYRLAMNDIESDFVKPRLSVQPKGSQEQTQRSKAAASSMPVGSNGDLVAKPPKTYREALEQSAQEFGLPVY